MTHSFQNLSSAPRQLPRSKRAMSVADSAIILTFSGLLTLNQSIFIFGPYVEKPLFWALVIQGWFVGRWCAYYMKQRSLVGDDYVFHLLCACAFTLVYASFEVILFGYPAASFTASFSYLLYVLQWMKESE